LGEIGLADRISPDGVLKSHQGLKQPLLRWGEADSLFSECPLLRVNSFPSLLTDNLPPGLARTCLPAETG